MSVVRKLLFPFSFLYALIVRVRNLMYDYGIFKSVTYDFPLICVGNLSVGGTGKTPMIEYLIRLLKDEHKVASLSRGYKRKTKGFLLADPDTRMEDIGDEPFQYHHKYNNIRVAVDADRVNGISELMKLQDPPEVILLDDAFQHRRVKAGLNIMLTVFDELYTDDWMLPMGNLRDSRKESARADIIIVTKCPADFSPEQKERVLRKIKPEKGQKVFFTGIRYEKEVISGDRSLSFDSLTEKNFSLVTGIARPSYLVKYLKSRGLKFEHLNFNDHHHFSDKEIDELNKKEMIITTEKDYVRLSGRVDRLYYLPIKVDFLFGEEQEFTTLVAGFIKDKSGVENPAFNSN
ncbi:tetraacyldisaccharide 4'-kinase [Leptobacterium flavescens]|uniref:Tetraacyldisaccharide 4'-kinase n=1 Tax=Leptobacterium flavescens TaxID=472055 RepID=A0A6P0UJ19_9FLAO|nr:tetraacyldisaccharide 4'-kinase [Leptobacterium flavescens]NER12380.1 tetraacyldisaccharide 4'-kinase [Leptobacterium flavescens]